MEAREEVRFKHESASATLVAMEDDMYSLHSLFSREPGKGHASEIMRKITNFADEKNAVIVLIVQRYHYGEGIGLDNIQLVHFYEKHGFDLDPLYGNGIIKKMVRIPSRK